MRTILLGCLLLAATSAGAQVKLHKRSYGTVLGYQRGKTDNIIFGAEYRWKKVSLFKAWTNGAAFHVEYSPGINLVGYRLGAYRKKGNLGLSYGASAVYFTDFKQNALAVTPTVGLQLLGFHLHTGFNAKLTNHAFERPNDFFIALTLFLPVTRHNDWDFTWFKKKKKRKKN